MISVILEIILLGSDPKILDLVGTPKDIIPDLRLCFSKQDERDDSMSIWADSHPRG